MIDLTIIMAIYGQPQMLTEQITTIRSYSFNLRSRLNLVIVDDCGTPPVDPDHAAFLHTLCNSVKLFRIEKDIPWNQMGARNLGMQHSSGWCLMIDPDMVFDADIMARMVQAAEKMQRGQVAKYGLKHKSSGKLDMSSPNTYLIHRDDFFAVGGYDESYAGHKGWSDVELLDVLRSCYKLQMRPDLFANFYSQKDIADAAVTTLDRSTKHNRKLRLKNVAKAKAAGGWARYAKIRASLPRCQFPWKQLYPTP